MASARRAPAAVLLHIALASIIGLVALALMVRTRETSQLPDVEARIAVEWSKPLSVSVSVSSGRRDGIVELSHSAASPVIVTLPASWSLREVRRSPLVGVRADPPVAAARRWHIPPGTVASFSVPDSPTRLVLLNPRRGLLSIRLTRIDVSTQTKETDVVLMRDAEHTLY